MSGRQVQHQHFMLYDQELNNKMGGLEECTDNTSVRTEHGVSRNRCTHLPPSEAFPGSPRELCLTLTIRKKRKKKQIRVTWLTVTGILSGVVAVGGIGNRYKAKIQPRMTAVVLLVRCTLAEVR